MLNKAIENLRASIIIFSFAEEQAEKDRKKAEMALKKVKIKDKIIYEDVYRKK